MVIEAACPVCSVTDAIFIRQYHYQQPLFADCSIVSCRHCGMAYAHPMPEQAVIDKYNASYFSNAHGGISDNALAVAFHSAINLLRVLHVEAFARHQEKDITHVLEIGPGGGYFARHWLRRNPSTYLYNGVESDISCHDNLGRIGVKVYGSMENIPADNRYDLMVISHVLEHTTDPTAFIHNCTRYLAPGGILFIEVPCRDFEHKAMDEPHLLFFDKEPMRALLEKCGVDHIRLSYHGNTIEALKKARRSPWSVRIRNMFLKLGLTFLFSRKEKGMEQIADPLERAVIKPFKAHIEQDEPSWWLRVIAVKK